MWGRIFGGGTKAPETAHQPSAADAAQSQPSGAQGRAPAPIHPDTVDHATTPSLLPTAPSLAARAAAAAAEMPIEARPRDQAPHFSDLMDLVAKHSGQALPPDMAEQLQNNSEVQRALSGKAEAERQLADHRITLQDEQRRLGALRTEAEAKKQELGAVGPQLEALDQAHQTAVRELAYYYQARGWSPEYRQVKIDELEGQVRDLSETLSRDDPNLRQKRQLIATLRQVEETLDAEKQAIADAKPGNALAQHLQEAIQNPEEFANALHADLTSNNGKGTKDFLDARRSLLQNRPQGDTLALPYNTEFMLLNNLRQRTELRDQGYQDLQSAPAKALAELNKQIAALENKRGADASRLNVLERTINLRQYQALANSLNATSDTIQQTTRNIAQLEAEIDAAHGKIKEEQGKLTGEQQQQTIKSLSQEISDKSQQLDTEKQKNLNLKATFFRLMQTLETYENEKTKEYGGDPFPQTSTVEDVWNWVKSFALSNPDRKIPKSELMLRYQLARNGLGNVSEAYVRAGRDAAASGKSLLLEGTNTKLTDIPSALWEAVLQSKDLAMQNPLLAKEVAASLMHAYNILAQDSTDSLKQLKDNAFTILQRRTVENLVSDGLLGQREHLFALESGAELSPALIALADFAQRAPYLAAAYRGAQGDTLESKLSGNMISAIPVIGSYEPLKAVVGAGTSMLGVKAQIEASRRISRQQEILANTVLTAYRSFQNGEGAGALKKAAAYKLARETLPALGSFFRDARELGGPYNALKGMASRWARETKANPAAEGRRLAAVGALGTAAAGAAGVAVLGTATVAAAPIAAAAAAGIGTAVLGRMAWGPIRDGIWRDAAQQRVLQESAQRLAQNAAKLPAFAPSDISKQELGTRRLDQVSGEEAARITSKADEMGKMLEKALTNLNASQPELYLEAALVHPKSRKDQEAFVKTRLAEELQRLEAEELTTKRKAELEAAAQIPEKQDPAVAGMLQALDTIPTKSAWPEIDLQLENMQKQLPEARYRDRAEDALYTRIQALRDRKTALTPADMSTLRDEIKLLRIVQLESAGVDANNLQNSQAQVTSSAAAAAAAQS